jgi:ribonuclease HII
MALRKTRVKSLPTFTFEKEARSNGALFIAGVDEVGRGPIAGPVVAAAVVLPEGFGQIGIDDSKRLLPAQRDEVARRIRKEAICWSIGVVDPEEIDRINIYQASRLAMKQAIVSMSDEPDFLLIDGNMTLDLEIAQRSVIKGDQLSISIASASILAKVARDGMMLEYHEVYPKYGFMNHKGYATRLHVEAVRKYGPCPIHRKSFRTVSDFGQLELFASF